MVWRDFKAFKRQNRRRIMQQIIRGEMPRTFYSDKEFERIEKRNKKRKEKQEDIKNGHL